MQIFVQKKRRILLSLILLYFRNDCIDDGVSLSSDSYRFFGFYEDEQPPEEGANLEEIKETWTKRNSANVESEHSLHVAFNMNTKRSKKKSSKNGIEDDSRSSSTDEWSDVVRSSSSSSSSTGSIHNDCSRYDNVPIGLLKQFSDTNKPYNILFS